jgi:cellulose synthase/poly-beta-1,6-N-acetylglucosamine synthase-like glycosyltransferase
MKQFIEILLVLALFLVFYTYVGYGIVAWVLVKIRTSLGKTFKAEFDPEYLPEVTLVVPAYNEMSCIESKLFNSLDLDYPTKKLNSCLSQKAQPMAQASISSRYALNIHMFG